MLLKRSDFADIFGISTHGDQGPAEYYAERTSRMELDFSEKMEKCRISTTSGQNLRMLRDGRCVQYSTTGKFDANREKQEDPEFPKIPPLFSELVKQTTRFEGAVKNLRVEMRAVSRNFEVEAEPGESKASFEKTATLRARFSVELKGKVDWFEWSRSRSEPLLLIREALDDHLLTSFLKEKSEERSAWPVPRGRFPLFFGPRAVSKLCLILLRSLEGDAIAERQSLFTERSKLPLSFSLEENPRLPFDHEGTPTVAGPVIQGGDIQKFALDRKLAQKLSYNISGHCRRENFRSFPTMGFWNASLNPDVGEENLLSRLPHGLFLEDFDIQNWVPKTSELKLHFPGASLIHQGEMGERVEPFTWNTSLTSILSRLRSFDKTEKTEGFLIEKDGSRFLTEVSCPGAFSEELEVPGTAPQSYYW